MFPGLGTLVNVAAVVAGCGVGLMLRGRFPERVSHGTTDGIALVVLLIGGLSAADVTSADLVAEVGSRAPVLIVLLSVLFGTVAGTLLRVEDRLAAVGAWAQRRFRRNSASGSPGAGDDDAGPGPGLQGFLTASILFCTGPLTILGSLQDGLGQGFELLAVKSTLDGFASIAFAAAFGASVLGSVAVIIVVQGGFTVLGLVVGDVLTAGQVSAISATGGVIMLGLALRLLQVRPTRDVAVADMLPSLLVAPLLVSVAAAL